MGIRFVRSAGAIHEPAVINMPASGVIQRDSVVVFDQAIGVVSPATADSPTTAIIGVALDYVQGASDTFTRVIPFVQGQIWEVDTVTAVTTANILRRHALYDATRIENISGAIGTSETSSTGIFLAYGITGLLTGSGKMIGTFLQRVSVLGKDGVASTT